MRRDELSQNGTGRRAVEFEKAQTRHGFDADLLANAVQKLIKEEVVLGKFHGSTFTPKAYTDAEANKVDGFFEANGYLTATAAKSSGLGLKDWAAQRKASGYNLVGAFVASHLVDSAMASISDALAGDGWIDAQPLLPHALTAADASELLLQLSSQKKLPSNAVVLDRVAASSGFIQSIAKALEAEVQKAAEAATKKKSGAKKAVEDEDDDLHAKKGGKRTKGAKKKRGDDDDAVETSRAGNAESGVPNDAIANYLADQHPDLPIDIQDDLCAKVQVLLTAMVAEVAEKLRSTLQTKQNHHFGQADKVVQERYERLVLGLRALEAAKLQESPLYQHLLKEVVLEPCHMLIALRLEEAGALQSLEKLIAAEGAAKVESLSRLAAVLVHKKEAKDAKEKSGKSKKSQGHAADEQEPTVADVSELYHAAVGDPVDKKKEKAQCWSQHEQEHRSRALTGLA
ncbi:UFL1 [Symbiodinium necroappetens]|uniref:UFL1 protein n=1 Tax=Symbiodinium necroappetens TaxID=1628268 RepID=A0A813AJ99_9DINO|nr:UFL1 [Symbiodinium necroappetens]